MGSSKAFEAMGRILDRLGACNGEISLLMADGDNDDTLEMLRVSLVMVAHQAGIVRNVKRSEVIDVSHLGKKP